MSNTNEKTSKRKHVELLHNALGVMPEELADEKDSFHTGKQCSEHAQIQSSQIWVSSFSLQINPFKNPGMFHSSRLLMVFLLV